MSEHVVCALDRGMIRGMLAGLYGETDPQRITIQPPDSGNIYVREDYMRAY